VDDNSVLRGIRHKKDRTNADRLLLKYHNVLCIISEILVEESKVHISSEEAIIDIRRFMDANLLIKEGFYSEIMLYICEKCGCENSLEK